MMGMQQSQGYLFHVNVNLDKRVRPDHPLRKIHQLIDFGFVYDEVRKFYGRNGNESVPPPVILKLMLLLIFYNVRSERELMETLPERLDWLWFLGYDLDSAIPNHSVLSKARKRWGTDIFFNLFQRTVLQCVAAGLVDGSKIFRTPRGQTYTFDKIYLSDILLAINDWWRGGLKWRGHCGQLEFVQCVDLTPQGAQGAQRPQEVRSTHLTATPGGRRVSS